MTSIEEKGIIVLGGGGHGKALLGVMLATGLPVTGVLDDTPEKWGKKIQGVPILGPISDFSLYPNSAAVIGLGDNAQRRAVAEQWPGTHWARVLYPHAYINPTARIGQGTVIFPGAIVGADVVLGEHVIVSGNVSVGHETILEDFVHAAPGVQIGGGVRVGRGAMFGMGSIVCPKLTIGEDAVLGAGAVAVKDIGPGCRAFGVPAKTVQPKQKSE